MSNDFVVAEESSDQGIEISIHSFLEQIRPTASAFHAVMFNISKLMPFNREPLRVKHALEEAIRIFAPIKGVIFKLRNNNIVCFVHRNTLISVERCITKFKRALPYDPILMDNHKRDKFCFIFDLGIQWDTLYEMVDDIENDPVYIVTKRQSDGSSTQLLANGISIETLKSLEKTLESSNLLSYLRRQPIYWYNGKESPQKIANHLFLSVQMLQDSLAISEPIMANTWLFKHITTLLDKQTIDFLPKLIKQNSIGNIHININLRSVITSGFHKFFNKYQKEKPLSFCVDIVDYMAHPDVLLFVREMLAEKDCRLILSGISAAHLDVIALDKIPASVFKINWSNGVSDRKDDIKRLIDKIGAYKIILHRCDTEKEIQEGLDCGIEQFQGYGLDKLIEMQTVD